MECKNKEQEKNEQNSLKQNRQHKEINTEQQNREKSNTRKDNIHHNSYHHSLKNCQRVKNICERVEVEFWHCICSCNSMWYTFSFVLLQNRIEQKMTETNNLDQNIAEKTRIQQNNTARKKGTFSTAYSGRLKTIQEQHHPNYQTNSV